MPRSEQERRDFQGSHSNGSLKARVSLMVLRGRDRKSLVIQVKPSKLKPILFNYFFLLIN